MNTVANIEMARRYAIRRWKSPSPNFSHGEDWRSSDQGLLISLFGGLLKAVEHDWQNAGRVLVDRTDVRILFESYQLSLPVRELDQCCRMLDTFVRNRVFPNWDEISNREQIAIQGQTDLVNQWTQHIGYEIFGGEEYLPHTSALLFFLCPGLNVYPKGNEDQLSLLDTSDFLGPPAINAPHNKDQINGLDIMKGWWARRLVWSINEQTP